MLALFKNVKLVAWAVIGVCLVSAAVLAYLQYASMVKQIASLSETVGEVRTDLSREKLRNQTLQATVVAWGEASDRQAQALLDLTERQHTAGEHLRELKDVLSKHDLKGLASKKPKLVENAVNSGTARTLRLLEQSTSPATVGTGPTSSSTNTSSAPSR